MINCSHVLAKGIQEHDSGRYFLRVSFGALAHAGGGAKESSCPRWKFKVMAPQESFHA